MEAAGVSVVAVVSDAVVVYAGAVLALQPAKMAATITSARMRARVFFMFLFSFFYYRCQTPGPGVVVNEWTMNLHE